MWEVKIRSQIYHFRLRIHHLGLLHEHVEQLPFLTHLEMPGGLFAPSRPPPYELLSAKRTHRYHPPDVKHMRHGQ